MAPAVSFVYDRFDRKLMEDCPVGTITMKVLAKMAQRLFFPNRKNLQAHSFSDSGSLLPSRISMLLKILVLLNSGK